MSHRHAAPRRREISRPLMLVVALVGLAIVLAGGYWWLSDDEPVVGPAASAADALPTTAWAKAGPDSVADGGRLRVAVSALPANFNPVQADGGGDTTAQVLAPTTGSPVRITTDGGWRVDSDYARAVDVVDKKPLTVRVRLNPDAVWQDGSPITAKDMTAFHRAMSGEVKGLQIASADGFDDIATVERGGDRFEYTVTFDTPRSDWPRFIYPRLPTDVSSKPKAFNKGFTSKAVPSNGPFVVDSIDKKTGTITEERNPRWWGGKPRLKQVVWRTATPSVQAKAFAAGELDAVSADATTYKTVAKSGMVQRAAGGTWSHLTINGGRGPLKDVEVRRAVAAAIDRKALAKKAGQGVGAPARTAGSFMLVPGQRGYLDVADRELKPGQAEAKALLEKAGYTQTNGKATKKGKPLTLTLPVPSDTPSSDARVTSIVADLKAVGITVKTPSVKAMRFFRDTVVPLDFDLVTFTWPAAPFPVQTAERRFRPIDSPQNFTGVTDKKLDRRWSDTSTALDDGARADRIHDLDARLMREAVVVPLSVIPDVVVVKRGLVNYGAATFEQPDFTIVGFRATK
ncbi:ABC transporter substrate-binding protein [Aeromicrobium sp.]|uniref:ABC transporter family substrate-binding protein n=1 Tax=Aeromicrobium sp. TaxID=1871063 RepID=UPI003C371C7F